MKEVKLGRKKGFPFDGPYLDDHDAAVQEEYRKMRNESKGLDKQKSVHLTDDPDLSLQRNRRSGANKKQAKNATKNLGDDFKGNEVAAGLTPVALVNLDKAQKKIFEDSAVQGFEALREANVKRSLPTPSKGKKRATPKKRVTDPTTKAKPSQATQKKVAKEAQKTSVAQELKPSPAAPKLKTMSEPTPVANKDMTEVAKERSEDTKERAKEL